MTPDRLRAVLAELHWTQQTLAELTEVNERQVRRWIAGASIPQRIADWLEVRLRLHEMYPAPGKKSGGSEN
jgi:transcriptional regulator with XRE-family HTH domain